MELNSEPRWGRNGQNKTTFYKTKLDMQDLLNRFPTSSTGWENSKILTVNSLKNKNPKKETTLNSDYRWGRIGQNKAMHL